MITWCVNLMFIAQFRKYFLPWYNNITKNTPKLVKSKNKNYSPCAYVADSSSQVAPNRRLHFTHYDDTRPTGVASIHVVVFMRDVIWGLYKKTMVQIQNGQFAQRLDGLYMSIHSWETSSLCIVYLTWIRRQQISYFPKEQSNGS